jgi:quinol monooxygenase YgiN
MYTIVWQFDVAPEQMAEFERVYGADGDWAMLFRRGEGYLGSDLFRSMDHANRYITVDRWTSHAAHEEFQARHFRAYAALDARCHSLTRDERQLGTREE